MHVDVQSPSPSSTEMDCSPKSASSNEAMPLAPSNVNSIIEKFGVFYDFLLAKKDKLESRPEMLEEWINFVTAALAEDETIWFDFFLM